MLLTLLSGRGRFITHLTGWLLVGTVMFYLLCTLRPVEEAAARTVMNLSFPFLIFYVNGRVLINRFFETKRYWAWGIWSVVLWLGMAALRTKAELSLFGSTVFGTNEYPVDGGWRVFLVIALLFFVMMLFSGLYQLLENRRELESLHAEAQLNYLKAQINPHFLFNTLNNIYSAATLQHPRTADMVLRLSDLLRYVTYDAQAEQVPLHKEVAHIRAYIDLFQLKSETPLPIHFTVDGDTDQLQIEPLLLLPLVENALKHSDWDSNPKGFLNILLRNEPGQLRFKVENTFDPTNQQKDAVGGVGLENITKRLQLKYGNRYSFIVGAHDGVYTAELVLKM
jgi:hypothetical protein